MINHKIICKSVRNHKKCESVVLNNGTTTTNTRIIPCTAYDRNLIYRYITCKTENRTHQHENILEET